MITFKVPGRAEVSSNNQAIFDTLTNVIGRVPNLYATFAYSSYALHTYLTLQRSPSSLNAKQKEVVNLVVSEINHCTYCIGAHTTIAALNGYSAEQISEIRSGTATFDPRLDALSRLVKSITENHGTPHPLLLDNFFQAGFTTENLVDVVVAIGDKIISNYLYAITHVPVDFPLAP